MMGRRGGEALSRRGGGTFKEELYARTRRVRVETTTCVGTREPKGPDAPFTKTGKPRRGGLGSWEKGKEGMLEGVGAS